MTQVVAEKSLTKKVYRQTNKQTDKTIAEKAKTTQVVAGKSLTEKSLQTDKQTNKQTNRQKQLQKGKNFVVLCCVLDVWMQW